MSIFCSMLSPHANPYVQIKSHSFNQTHFLFFSYHLQSDSCAKLYHKKNSHIYVARQWWLEQSRAHMMNVNLFFPLLFSLSLSHRQHSSNNIAHTKESVLMKTWVSYHWELVRETLKSCENRERGKFLCVLWNKIKSETEGT